MYSVHCEIGAAFVHNITFGNFRQYVYLTLKGLNTAVLHSTYYTVMLSSSAGRRSAPPEGMGGGRKSQTPKKLDRSRSEGRGFMAKHHLYKIWAHTLKKRHVDVP